MTARPSSAAPEIDVRTRGLACDGSTDDTTAAQALMATLSGGEHLFFPNVCKISGTLQVNVYGLTIRGEGEIFGSRIDFSGTGPLFQIGTDNGHAYDANEYDGPDGFNVEDIELRGAGTLTALSNGQGSYRAGSYGIRDWRGGTIHFNRARCSQFDYGVWGIQSDFDSTNDSTFTLNKTGIYVGPRTDQYRCTGTTNFTFNDRAVEIDSAWGAVFTGTTFVDNGATGINPIKIHSTYPRRGRATYFNGCWFEHLIGPASLEAFIEAGVGDSSSTDGVYLRNTTVMTNPVAGPVHMQYLVKLGNCTNVGIDEVFQPLGTGIDSLLYAVDTTHTPDVYLKLSRDLGESAIAAPVLGASALAPRVHRMDWGNGAFGFADGVNGRAQVRILPSGNFPVIEFVKPDGTVMWKLTGSVNDAGQIWFDAPGNTSQFHIRDDGAVDVVKFQPSSGLTLGKSGGNVGFFGTTPVAKQSLPAAATDAATTQALANALRTALINLGLAS